MEYTTFVAMSDREFASKFITLATLTPPVLADTYSRPSKEIDSVGVALPVLPYKYDPDQNYQKKPTYVKLELKSVRPPKFNVEANFETTDTILAVKRFLQSSGTVPADLQLKLLIKGKVLHDDVLLSDLKTDHASITVMSSKIAAKEVESSSPCVKQPSGTQLPWNDIEKVLLARFSTHAEAKEALAKLKKGWEYISSGEQL